MFTTSTAQSHSLGSDLGKAGWKLNNVTTIHQRKLQQQQQSKHAEPPKSKEDALTQMEALVRIQSMYGATVATAAILTVFICKYVDLGLPPMPTPGDRLLFTMQCQVLSIAAIVYTIFGVLNVRGTVSTGWNTSDPKSIKAVEVPQKVLQNMVEQYLLHAGSLAVLSTYLEEEQMSVVPVMVSVWSVGRVLFCIGYSYHNLYRVPGFGLSFFPSVFTIAYLTYRSYGVLPGIVWWPLALIMGYVFKQIAKFFLVPFGYEYTY